MTFEEWFEEERVGYSREEELNRALYVDMSKVTQMLKEAYESGYENGWMDRHTATAKVKANRE